LQYIIFYVISFIGWKCFAKLKMPVPAVLGPILAIGLANYYGFHPVANVWLKPFLSVIMGVLLGFRFNFKLKGILKEIIMVSSWLILVSYLSSQALILTGLPPTVAAFASFPGALAEIALIAMSFGASTFEVALLMTTRMLCTVVVITALTKRIRVNSNNNVECNESVLNTAGRKEWCIILILVVLSSYLLSLIKMPSGNLIGPMLAVGFYIKAKNLKVKVNKTVYGFAQMGIGGMIGLNITKESIMAIPNFLIPIIVLNIIIVGGSLFMGYLLHRMNGWDLVTCLLATAPAAVTPIVMLALELKADSTRVLVFQMVRYITVILCAPFIAQLLLN